MRLTADPWLRCRMRAKAFADARANDPAPNGGSGIHYAETLGKALKGVNNITTVIPGHSPLMKIADLAGYQKFVADPVEPGEKIAETK